MRKFKLYLPKRNKYIQIQDEPNYFLLKFDIKTKGHHSI